MGEKHNEGTLFTNSGIIINCGFPWWIGPPSMAVLGHACMNHMAGVPYWQGAIQRGVPWLCLAYVVGETMRSTSRRVNYFEFTRRWWATQHHRRRWQSEEEMEERVERMKAYAERNDLIMTPIDWTKDGSCEKNKYGRYIFEDRKAIEKHTPISTECPHSPYITIGRPGESIW
eukprot:NODE_1309_length_628_cov_189.385147_g1027_i0.p1 GENE.NODE_1309_length_628_cov_189.385147_g1027_i0~~NODE_1309_length_628_cov_189.385147_g1027_i0.p1  ORF type:complete len:182 (+),score=17.61 NODE_1309_length_628_cov_189.385147_g1027_i0:29-547(+)